MKDDRFITGDMDVNDMDLVNSLLNYEVEEEHMSEDEEEWLEDLNASRWPLQEVSYERFNVTGS